MYHKCENLESAYPESMSVASQHYTGLLPAKPKQVYILGIIVKKGITRWWGRGFKCPKQEKYAYFTKPHEMCTLVRCVPQPDVSSRAVSTNLHYLGFIMTRPIYITLLAGNLGKNLVGCYMLKMFPLTTIIFHYVFQTTMPKFKVCE